MCEPIITYVVSFQVPNSEKMDTISHFLMRVNSIQKVINYINIDTRMEFKTIVDEKRQKVFKHRSYNVFITIKPIDIEKYSGFTSTIKL